MSQGVVDPLSGVTHVDGVSITGVLTRCLRSLEETDHESTEATRTTEALKEVGHNIIHVLILYVYIN